ncbi:MAG: hypothetical protein K0R39_1557, partial [Symbiobacteriaceae bacterium]|nr:hypothetical protein [Symbiobacteriaceae bacterium]
MMGIETAWKQSDAPLHNRIRTY